MCESPQVKEWILPAGRIVKVEDLPFRLVADTVVRGANEPRWYEGPFLEDDDDEPEAESGERSLSQDQSTQACDSPPQSSGPGG